MKMIPENYILSKKAPGFSGAEKKLFDVFKNMPNTEGWVCFHSLRFIATDEFWHAHIDRELDFILFIPSRGVFFIEVKGGGISYNGSTNTYSSINLEGRQNKIKDPFKQIRNAKYDFIKWLKKRKGTDIIDISAQCVFFPDTSKERGNLPWDNGEAYIFYQEDIPNLHNKILNIFKTELPNEKRYIIKGLIPFLTPRDFSAPMSFESIINYNRDTVNYATQEQMRILELLSLCPKAIINGVAGSGKTLLALTKAVQIAENDPENRVLYTCYTKQLPDQLKSRCPKLPDNLIICHFHKLAKDLLQDKFPHFPTENDWNSRIPDLIFDLPKIFSAIFIDESQDFTEEMLLALENLCIEENAYFWLFGDSNQNLFRKERRSFTQYFRGNYVFPLAINCRNPKQIAEHAYSYIPDLRYKTALNEGLGEAETIQCLSEEDQAKKIVDLITTKNLLAQNTVLLTMRPKTKASNASVFKSKYSHIFEEFNTDNIPAKIPVSNIQNFKGMEAEVVILCDVDNTTDAIEMYTASTRATAFLYIFHMGELSIKPHNPTTQEARNILLGNDTRNSPERFPRTDRHKGSASFPKGKTPFD